MITFTPAYALFRCSFRCVRHVTLPYRPHITPLLASLEDGRGHELRAAKRPAPRGNRALGPNGASDRNRRAASPPSVRCGPCGPLRAAPANGSAVSSAPRPQPGSIPAAGSKTPGSAGNRALGPNGASDRNRRAASPPSVRCGPCGPLRAAPANGSAVSSAPRPQPGSIPAAGSKTPGSAGEPGARTLWSQRQESNPQPTDYKSVALPLSHAGASGAYARKASTGY